jgi:hypothetical protein
MPKAGVSLQINLEFLASILTWDDQRIYEDDHLSLNVLLTHPV